MPRFLFLSLAVWLGAAGSLLSQAPPEAAGPALPGIAWEADYDKALARAAAEKKPLMIAFVMKDEPANEAIMREHFKDPDIIAMSRNFVCLVACQGLEGDVEGPRSDGTVGQVSAKLGAVSASEIRAIEFKARTKLLEAAEVSCPQFVFLSPDTKSTLLRHVWTLPRQALLQKMKVAFAFHAPASAGDAEKALAAQVEEAMKRAVDKDPAVRRPALSTLADLGDPRVPPFLVERTAGDLGALVRSETIFFGMGKENNALALARLHALLSDRDALIRVHAAVAVGKVGLIDSVPHLQKALRNETQDRVRSHLIRALGACMDDREELRRAVNPYFKAKGTAEALAVAHLAKGLSVDESIEQGVKSLLGSRTDEVRVAAYVVAGSLTFQNNWDKVLKSRIPTEKDDPRAAAEWALARMGGPAYEGEVDPEAIAYQAMPDNHLWEGNFDPPAYGEDDRRNRPGGGRGGGGRGGGGRGGGGRGGR